MRHHRLGGLFPKSSKTAVWWRFEAWIIVTTKRHKKKRIQDIEDHVWIMIYYILPAKKLVKGWSYFCYLEKKSWNHNRQAWIRKVTTKRHKQEKNSRLYFIYESWYIISYNIYPAKKLVKMARHTFACNSATSFLNGESNHRKRKCCKLIWEK